MKNVTPPPKEKPHHHGSLDNEKIRTRHTSRAEAESNSINHPSALPSTRNCFERPVAGRRRRGAMQRGKLRGVRGPRPPETG